MNELTVKDAVGGANQASLKWDELALPPWLLHGVRQATGRSDRPYKAQAEVFAVCDQWSSSSSTSSSSTNANLLATAANGSGKTLAFGLPALKT